MRASRIVFALADLMSELRAISPVQGEDGPAPVVELGLDAATFNAAMLEIEDRVGQPIARDPDCAGQAVRFQGLRIRALPGVE